MQTSSIAVAATVTALVVALGVSGAAMRGREAGGSSRVALGTASSTSAITQTAAPAGRTATPATRRAGPATSPSVADAPADEGAREAVASTPEGTAPEPPAVLAAGDGSSRAEGESRVELRPAAPGDWLGTARVIDRTGLLGEAEQTVETRTAVGPETSGAQRIDVDGNVLALAGETVRYDGLGRRSFVLDVWTGDAEPVRFTSQDGFLAVPTVIRAGSSWSWAGQSTDRRTSLDASLRLIGQRRVTYAEDREIDVIDYEQTVTIGGDRSLTITRKVAFAPEIGLPVRIDEETKGTSAAGSTIDRSVVFELTSSEPAPKPVVDSP